MPINALSRRDDSPARIAPSAHETRVVFRTLGDGAGGKGHRGRWFLVTSVTLHIGILLALSMYRRPPKPTEARVRVSVIDPAGAPKTRPAGRPESKPLSTEAPPRRREHKPLVAPKAIVPESQSPREIPPDSDEDIVEETSSAPPGGTAGDGTLGNGAGHTAALAPAPTPPTPPPLPAPPVFENEASMRRRRTAGHDPGYPAKAEASGIEGVVVAKVFIGPDGRVSDVNLLQTHPAFEAAVRDAIAGWKFAPLMVNGAAATVYTVFRFTFKLS